MVSVQHKALVGQAEAALLAVEAVLVPGVALVVHHVGAVAEPCSSTQDRTGDIPRSPAGTNTTGAVWVDGVFRSECRLNFSLPLDTF